MNVVRILLIASIAIMAIYATVAVVYRILYRFNVVTRKRRIGVSSLIIFSAFLLTSTWCMRYAVGYFNIQSPPPEGPSGLSWWEEISNCMIHALQTFSMDEDYTIYITNGRRMLEALFGADTFLTNFFRIYATLLNIAAPVAGGAVIFEILASIFPRIKFAIYRYVPWREKYYFSELNDSSLAILKSLYDKNTGLKPIVIFTDAYIDSNNERLSELFVSAKLYGAICVKDDMTSVPKCKYGKRKIFLIDKKEINNLKALTDLANKQNRAFLKKAVVYLYSQGDGYRQVESRVREVLEQDKSFKVESLRRKAGQGKKEIDIYKYMPTIVPVQKYRNMISNMLVDIPLYEPLIGKAKNKNGKYELNIAILGAGAIGIEMFLSSYWFSQMLNCKTTITVVSKEDNDEFWNKIDSINPEIRASTEEGNEILRCNENEFSEPYCDVKYAKCDINSSAFVGVADKTAGNKVKENCDGLENEKEAENAENEKNIREIMYADYIFIALGSDEANIEAANALCNRIGQRHIKHKSEKKTEPNKTVITYVVYDSDLASTLNLKKHYNFVNGPCADVYMRAVGSVSEVYDTKNVFMENYTSEVERLHGSYTTLRDKLIGNASTLEEHKKRAKTPADDYRYWANISRAMHKNYKAFSLGLEGKSIFEIVDDEKYQAAQKNMLERYRCFAHNKPMPQTVGERHYEFSDKEKEKYMHELSWLEHRRWQAFTRVKGFRTTKEYGVYATNEIGSYKQMELKLHPCLVECDKNGVRTKVSAEEVEKKRQKYGINLWVDGEYHKDCLDKVTEDLASRGINNIDFKIYNYPYADFNDD